MTFFLSDDASASSSPSAPSLALLGLEPLRAAIEYAGMHLMSPSALPAGDGHPVVLFPGLASDRRALLPLRHLCEKLNYTVYDWEQGFNTGPQGDIDDWIAGLVRHVEGIADQHGGRVSLIGWSLGGIYAREIAKLLPDKVRQVITLGTPFSGTPEHTNVGWLYRLLNREGDPVEERLSARLRATPPVPTTSIYSRSDGVVAWQACVTRDGSAYASDIEVEGSHIGLAWNSKVLAIIAEQLSRPEQPRAAATPLRPAEAAARRTRVRSASPAAPGTPVPAA